MSWTAIMESAIAALTRYCYCGTVDEDEEYEERVQWMDNTNPAGDYGTWAPPRFITTSRYVRIFPITQNVHSDNVQVVNYLGLVEATKPP